MKSLRLLKKIVYAALMSAVSLAGLTSCSDSFIFDDEGDCTVTYKLRFVYDMNLKWADAFASEVKSVNLYVFDMDGIFVKEIKDAGEALSLPGYALTLDLPYGDYRLVAWCGLDNEGADEESFSVPRLVPGQSTIDELTCSLRTDASRADAVEAEYSDRRLYFLYHGMISRASLVDTQDGSTRYLTMYLTKDTNHIRVILQELTGERLDPAEFDMNIEAADGLLAYDNNLLGNTPVIYGPWDTLTTEMGFEQDGTTIYNYGVAADFSTSRMMASQRRGFLLTVSRHDGEEVIARVPLIQYALLAKEYYEMAYSRPMTDQEFLDREDEYEVTFFLQNGKWINSQILINSWRVVLHDYDLES